MTQSIFQEKVYANDSINDQSTIAKDQKITALFLGCQVNADLWVPVKKMIWINDKYQTGYVGGVKDLIAAGSVWRHYFRPQDFKQVKITRDVHCDYASRMPLDRPEEMPYNLPHLGLPADLADPIAYVARSGGYRETEDLDVFPEVEVDSDGCYRFYFLLRKLHFVNQSAIDLVEIGDEIITQKWNAIHQSTGQPMGIVPGYIRALTLTHREQVRIEVHQVNHIELPQVKLLCSLTCKGFIPFTSIDYLPLADLA
jgi:hypothetical protein